MSCKIWRNSIFVAGSCSWILPRTSAMTSSIPRFRSLFSLTVKSPRLASVTAARPSSRPVRLDVFSTSGVSLSICSMRKRIWLDSASELPGGVQ